MSTPGQKIALITGANKGIGFEVARAIGRTGVTILVGARNETARTAAVAKLTADGLRAQFIQLDVTDRAAVHAAAHSIETSFGRLDILVNNAGIFMGNDDGPPSISSLDSIETTFRTNFFGAVAVTRAMLPLLRKSDAARIVNVSSGLGSLTLNGDLNYQHAGTKYLGYNASKAALNMLTVQLAYELRDTRIKVNSSNPGYTATDLNGNSGPQSIAEGAAETIRLALLPDRGPTGTFSDSEGIVAW